MSDGLKRDVDAMRFLVRVVEGRVDAQEAALPGSVAREYERLLENSHAAVGRDPDSQAFHQGHESLARRDLMTRYSDLLAATMEGLRFSLTAGEIDAEIAEEVARR